MSRLGGKLLALGITHALKPIRLAIQYTAKGNKNISFICQEIGQKVHYLDCLVSKQRYEPLNEELALETGAGTISEWSLFSLALWLILYQNDKSKKNELARHENVIDDIKMLQLEIEDLRTQLKEQTLIINDFFVPYGTKPSVLVVDEMGKVKSSKF